MFFLLYIIIMIVIYISSFKENFTTEKIEKITPIMLFTLIIIVVLCIVSSLVKYKL